MKKNRAELDAELDRLAAGMPAMLERTQESDQMEAFAGLADEIRESAGSEDSSHVWSRLQCILRENGLIPGDDEPCS